MSPVCGFNIRGRIYQLVMKIAHRYHWHYAPPIYIEGDTHLWCEWCGFRMTLPRVRFKLDKEPK